MDDQLTAAQEFAFRDREIQVKEREVAAKERELRFAPWRSPTFYGLVGAFLAIGGNALIAWYNNQSTLKLQQLNSEAGITLEAIKTDQDGACKNLIFLANVGLITKHRDRIRELCKDNKAPGRPSLPAASLLPQAHAVPESDLVVPSAISVPMLREIALGLANLAHQAEIDAVAKTRQFQQLKRSTLRGQMIAGGMSEKDAILSTSENPGSLRGDDAELEMAKAHSTTPFDGDIKELLKKLDASAVVKSDEYNLARNDIQPSCLAHIIGPICSNSLTRLANNIK